VGGRGTAKNEQRPYERERAEAATPALPDSPEVRSADQEREALSITSYKKGALSITRRRKR
jgi:hypothetical protein